MNIEEKKRELKGKRHYQIKLDSLYARWAEIRENAYIKVSPGAIQYNDMPKAEGHSDWTDDINKMLDEEKTIIANIKKYSEKIIKINLAIENLEEIDVELAEVIELKYFNRYSIPQIAREMYLSERSINRKHKKAITLLNL